MEAAREGTHGNGVDDGSGDGLEEYVRCAHAAIFSSLARKVVRSSAVGQVRSGGIDIDGPIRCSRRTRE